MYSRNRGHTPARPMTGARDRHEAMYQREPAYRRTASLQVPYNYSGNAFREEPAVEDASVLDENEEAGETESEIFGDKAIEAGAVDTSPAETTSDVQEPHDEPSVRPVATLPILDGKHFPFGHGLGYEELIILGLIVFLINECDGEGDLNETLLLLGILLLCG